jgi:hypothetical protein
MPEANRIASPSPAATVVCCRPKVSESSSPRRHDTIGENLVQFGGPAPPPRAERAAVITPPLPAESPRAIHPGVNGHD